MSGPVGSVLVVGGGIGGVNTCAALRSGGFDGDITLVDAGEFPYDRPPLSKEFLAGHKDLKQIALQPPEWYDAHGISLFNNTRVAALVPRDRGVRTEDGRLLHADRVVLATGGRAAVPPIPGRDSPRVHVLRSAEHATRLQAELVPGARLLVVGAGLIGAEAASTAVDLGCEVVLVDPVSPPLAAAVGDDVAEWLHAMHTTRGVQVVHAGVVSMKDIGSAVDVRLTDDSTVVADVVVLGVGMVPATELAVDAGLDVHGGILVDEGQVSSNRYVLAVGDPVRHRRPDGTLAPRAEHWEAAQHDAERAAATILGKARPAATAPWFWTDRHHRHVEVVGHRAQADTIVHRGSFDDDTFATFGLRNGKVVFAASVDEPLAVRAARRMIDRGVTPQPDKLADTAADLRKLVRG
jgi:3-phenylpropionate/trans-cinnamate dioxygenase ferredoxin reductase subunit